MSPHWSTLTTTSTGATGQSPAGAADDRPLSEEHAARPARDRSNQRDRLTCGEARTIQQVAFARLASLVGLADYASAYLALLQGTDPTPVDAITALKQRISR